VGASGSGKSSLLRAGVVAALGDDTVPGSARWPVLVFTPGAHPLDELARQLATVADAPAAEVGRTLRGDPGRSAGYLAHDDGDTGTAVVVVDQFEELFTTCADEDERRLFVTALDVASASAGALVVAGLRADFYAQALRYRPLRAAAR